MLRPGHARPGNVIEKRRTFQAPGFVSVPPYSMWLIGLFERPDVLRTQIHVERADSALQMLDLRRANYGSRHSWLLQ